MGFGKLRRSFEKRFMPQRNFYGLGELDKKLLPFLRTDPGFFVELGANDGVDQSNTLHLERARNWRGVLIEPVPHNFLKCRENRRHTTKVFCAACVPFDYKDESVRMVYSNLMSIAVGMDVATPHQHAETGKRFIGSENIFEFDAPARTLTNILSEALAPSEIDLLSLDVEGNELSVLRGINFGAYRFHTMLIESFTGPEALKSYLSEFGYELVASLTAQDHVFQHNTARPLP